MARVWFDIMAWMQISVKLWASGRSNKLRLYALPYFPQYNPMNSAAEMITFKFAFCCCKEGTIFSMNIYFHSPPTPPTPPKRWRLSGDIDVFLLSFNLAEPEKYCGASHSTTDAARKPSAIAIPPSERDKSSQRRLQRKKNHTDHFPAEKKRDSQKNKLKQQLSLFFMFLVRARIYALL